MTAVDECFDAVDVDRLLAGMERSPTCAVVIGSGWCCVDPALVDQAVERHAEDPTIHRLALAHAAPGLGVAVLERRLISELASARKAGGLWGSLGGLLGYSPVAPAADVIGKGVCVGTSPAVRQLAIRATVETDAEARWLERAFDAAGLSAIDATAEQLARAINTFAATQEGAPPARHIELRLVERGDRMPIDVAGRWLTKLETLAFAGASVTLRNAHMEHPAFDKLLNAARRAAGGTLCVHVRTDLCGLPEQVDRLLRAEPDIVSVDCHASTPELYVTLTGRSPEAYARLRVNIERLVEGRTRVEDGVRLPLVAPRLTRRDAVYNQLEEWYDRHLLACGWAVLDPLESPVAGERIAPLPVPTTAQRRLSAESVVVHADGRSSGGEGGGS
ncbi:MAG: hypothetical protein QM783_18535 [Phycisphaerales bacterium]